MANDESMPDEAGSEGQPTSASHPDSQRHRKRKVKRSSRIKRKAGYIMALAIAWLVFFAIWYYLVNHPSAPPPS